MQVEILGLYDRATEVYRLYASAPQNNVSSSQRFLKILKPVLSVVHHNAEIVCDHSIDANCLPSMNYKKVLTAEYLGCSLSIYIPKFILSL